MFKECDAAYYGQFCENGVILYDAIPSGCPQHDPKNSCNTDYFVKNTKGSCCPITGKDCVPEFNNFFCNFDGTFKKSAYTQAQCDVPVCAKACD